MYGILFEPYFFILPNKIVPQPHFLEFNELSCVLRVLWQSYKRIIILKHSYVQTGKTAITQWKRQNTVIASFPMLIVTSLLQYCAIIGLQETQDCIMPQFHTQVRVLHNATIINNMCLRVMVCPLHNFCLQKSRMPLGMIGIFKCIPGGGKKMV